MEMCIIRRLKSMRVKPYQPKRLFLETLIGYVEAAQVRTLDEFRCFRVVEKDGEKR
jgi:hypothetical protein